MGPRAPPGWGAPGPSSASSCGCGCRALPRSLTPTAGMSAGRCHGGPCLCPTISAAPGGHRPSVLPWMRICSLALSWCRDWGDAGNHGCGMYGHLGHPDPFSRAYFSRTPSMQGSGGGLQEHWQNFHRAPGGKQRRSKPQKAFGADIPSSLLLHSLSCWSCHRWQCLPLPSLWCLCSGSLAKL